MRRFITLKAFIYVISSRVPIPVFTAFVQVKNMPAIKPVDRIATIIIKIFIFQCINKNGPVEVLIRFVFSSEGRTRTYDLRVMSPTSYQLLHLAICWQIYIKYFFTLLKMIFLSPTKKCTFAHL